MKTKRMFLAAVMSVFGLSSLNSAMAATTTPTSTKTEVATTSGESHLLNIDHTDKVNANATDVYTEFMYAGEEVWVYVKGDGDTDLDLYIYDSNGNLMSKDTDNTDQCLCIFKPSRAGNYKIKVKNLGGVYNRYQLIILQ